MWLNIGEGEGQIKVRMKVSGVNVRNLDGVGGGAIAVPFLCLQCYVPSLAPLSPGLFVFLPLETEEDNDNPWNEVAFVFRHFSNRNVE